MKRFIGFVIKEFYHILRDRRSLLILFGMPVVQILLFGFAITNELRNAKVAILDHSHDQVTQQITSKLLSSGYFVIGEELQAESQIEQVFRQGKVKTVIIFGPEFAGNLGRNGQADVQIISDATDPNTASTLTNYTTSILQDFLREYNPQVSLPYTVEAEVRMLYNPGLKSVFMFVPGVMTIILMLVSAMMTSISIAREKESGTMEILLVSPLAPLQVILGKVVPYFLLSVVNAAVILLMGAFIFGMPIAGNIWLLAAETMLFILTALSLGIFISTRTETQQTAMMISLMVLMLPTILLSGFIFPIESMPMPLQLISNIIPARWFITIIKGILLKGVGLQFLWKETLILVGMTVFLTGLSIKNYKIRLE